MKRPGLDVGAFYEDVRRIFYKRQAPRLKGTGLDAEDVLATVLWKLVQYQASNPYDPSRGKESTYIFQVCRSVTNHALDKAANRRRFEQLAEEADAAETDGRVVEASQELPLVLRDRLRAEAEAERQVPLALGCHEGGGTVQSHTDTPRGAALSTRARADATKMGV